MRKQDIKPGVVYAYREGRLTSDWREPSPCVFLAAPADGQLYATSRSRGTDGAPYFKAALKGAKASWPNGYPVVMIAHTDHIPDAVSVTLADFETATSAKAPGGRYSIVSNLAYIVGPYDEVIADRKIRWEAGRLENERQREIEQARRRRGTAVIAALAAAGVRVDRLPMYDEDIVIPLAEAEKLIALLADGPAPE